MAELTCGGTATGEALQLVTLFLVLITTDHLVLITVSKAGITVAQTAQYPVVPNKVQMAQYVCVFRSLPFILQDSQPLNDFRGVGILAWV